MIDAKKIQDISIQILRTHSGSGESRRATDHALGSHPRHLSANLLYIERSGTSFLACLLVANSVTKTNLSLSLKFSKSIFQWIGLRENLQETIDFPIKYGAFL